MATVVEHYAAHLAPVYVWMCGGFDAALAVGAADVAALLPGNGVAVDLGAGFGMHSIPLARGGYEVVAVDTSATLLAVLSANQAGLPIRTVAGDLRRFRPLLSGRADLIVCLGDTLTHLESYPQIERLCEDIRLALAPGGRFVATFRDYTAPATDERRFIPVRSDADRILTCFLEEEPTHVKVHDILHERGLTGWAMKVSSYRKLRLRPADVERILCDLGLSVRLEAGPRGMIRLQAGA